MRPDEQPTPDQPSANQNPSQPEQFPQPVQPQVVTPTSQPAQPIVAPAFQAEAADTQTPQPSTPLTPEAPQPFQPPQSPQQFQAPAPPQPGTFSTTPAAGSQPALDPTPQVATPDSLTPFQPQPVVNGQPVSMSKSRKPLLAATLVVAMLLLLGAASAWYFLKIQNSPQKVYDAAFANALRTKSFTQDIAANGAKLHLVADTANVQKVRTNASATIDFFGTQIAFSEYSGNGNDFIKYDKLGSDTASAQSKAILNKWVQIKKDGKSVANDSSFNLSTGGYSYAVLGELITGNFSKSQQTTLVKYMHDQQVYKADTNKAVSTQVDGKAAYRYDVTINTAALKKLNAMAIKLTGSRATVDDLNLESAKTAKLYVDKHSKHVIKVEAKDSGSEVTVTYGSINSSDPGKAPTPQLTVDQLNAGLGTLPADGTVADNASAQDSMRQTDIQSIQSNLEAFYAANGSYPTLNQLNDPSWVMNNLKGLDPQALKDPEGSAATLAAVPAAHVYAYATSGCSTSGCAAYVLTAILSDGSSYTKNNL